MKINKTTTFYIIAIGITIIMIFFYSLFMDTTWGGWKPPSLAFSLSPSEIKWKKNIETEYECNIDYVGFEDNSIYEDVKDSSIYIKLHYFDSSILNNQLNDSIEYITSRIGQSFTKNTLKKRLKTEKRIFIIYTHKQAINNEIIKNNIPEYRSCIYDFKKKIILPVSKQLIINKFPFFNFFDEKLYCPELGQKGIYFYNTVLHTDSVLNEFKVVKNYRYKLLDECIYYSKLKPNKISTSQLDLEYFTDYIYYQNRCIYSKVVYQCIPKSKETRALNFIRKVTELSPEMIKNSKEDKLKLIDKLKQSRFNFNQKLYGFNVKFHVDSLSKPWKIIYETALDDFKFYKTFD
jgi:hypothetical protein